MIWLWTIPLPFALLCLLLSSDWARRISLVAGGAAHFAAIAWLWSHPVTATNNALLGIDPLGFLFISLLSLLFLATAIFFAGYHQKQLVSQRVFLACMLFLLSSLTLVCMSRHLGLMWVALEASSLAVTPLIYFRLGAKSLEATWKFLLMNSVGIALALLGIFCMGVAVTRLGMPTEGSGLSLDVLLKAASTGKIDPSWLRLAFLLALVGFGTKMGLAPLHSWKPDAYSESPPPVAALLAGGVTLGGFIGILRVFQICMAANQGPFAGWWMTLFGLLSIAIAGLFIIGNKDYRRILAYTSVEHMGVLVLGVGLIGLGASSTPSASPSDGGYSSMLHALHNTLNKGALFFVVGILWRIYNSNRLSDVRGVIHRHPLAGILLLAGLCATTALPPFGMFYSEFGILLEAIRQHQWWVAALFALTMAIVFVAVMTALLPMALGQPSAETAATKEHLEGGRWRETFMFIPTISLVLLAMWWGVYQPAFVGRALHEAAQTLSPQSTPVLSLEARP